MEALIQSYEVICRQESHFSEDQNLYESRKPRKEFEIYQMLLVSMEISNIYYDVENEKSIKRAIEYITQLQYYTGQLISFLIEKNFVILKKIIHLDHIKLIFSKPICWSMTKYFERTEYETYKILVSYGLSNIVITGICSHKEAIEIKNKKDFLEYCKR